MTRECPINNSYRIVKFLTVSISHFHIDLKDKSYDIPLCLINDCSKTLNLHEDLRLISTSDSRERNVFALYNTLTHFLKSAEDFSVIFSHSLS